MKIITKAIIVLLVMGTVPSWFANAGTVQDCEEAERQVATLIEGYKKLYEGVDPQQGWFYHDRLLALFEGAAPKDIAKLFRKLSQEDVEKLAKLVEAGIIELSPKNLRLLRDLRDALGDTEGIFWQKKEEGEKNTRRDRIVRTLQQSKDRLGELDGNNRSEMPDHAIRALDETEANLVKAAAQKRDNEGNRYPGSGWWKQLIFPLYPRIVAIRDFLDVQRNNLHVTTAADSEVSEVALKKAKELGLTPQEVSELRWLLARSIDESRSTTQAINQALGRDSHTPDVVPSPEMDPYAVYRNIKHIDLAEQRARAQRHAERDLDRMEATVNAALDRQGKPGMGIAGYTAQGRQIRHDEAARKINERANDVAQALAVETGEKIPLRYSWTDIEYTWTTETTTSTDANGNTTTSSHMVAHPYPVTRNGSTVHNVTYDEIVSGNIDTHPPQGNLTNGNEVENLRQRILGQSEPIRRKEHALHQQYQTGEELLLTSIQSQVEVLKSDPSKRQKLAELQASRDSLANNLSKLDKYRSQSRDDVSGQWKGDDYNDFILRNGMLAERYRNLVRYYDIYMEQLRRGETSLTLPQLHTDFPDELAALKTRYDNANAIKFTAAAAALAASVFGAVADKKGWWPFEDDDSKWLREARERIHVAQGIDPEDIPRLSAEMEAIKGLLDWAPDPERK